jgi:hypothetical protein
VSPLRANSRASCKTGRSVTAPDLLGENLLASGFGQRVALGPRKNPGKFPGRLR